MTEKVWGESSAASFNFKGTTSTKVLVFRAIYFPRAGCTHSRSEMPLTKELRIFFLHGDPITIAPQWEEGNYAATVAPLHQFQEAAGKIKSRFFSMDVAQKKDGEWLVIELGDGQVAGLPGQADKDLFFQALANAQLR